MKVFGNSRIPAVLGVELIAGFNRVPRVVAWVLRISLSLATPRILLHGSVYLSSSGDWTSWRAGATIVVCGLGLALLWSLLSWLSSRSGGLSISFALCLAIQCSGVAVMLAGYIKGGAAAIPLVATLLVLEPLFGEAEQILSRSVAQWLFSPLRLARKQACL